MNPTPKQYPSGPGRGIAQWSAGARWDTYDNDNAVVAFQTYFEGCSVCMTDNRVRYADQALAYYG